MLLLLLTSRRLSKLVRIAVFAEIEKFTKSSQCTAAVHLLLSEFLQSLSCNFSFELPWDARVRSLKILRGIDPKITVETALELMKILSQRKATSLIAAQLREIEKEFFPPIANAAKFDTSIFERWFTAAVPASKAASKFITQHIDEANETFGIVPYGPSKETMHCTHLSNSFAEFHFVS